jgi:3-dehydroquinate synthase
MDRISVQGLAGRSDILIGEVLENLRHYIPANQVYIITDDHVYSIYGKRFPAFPVYSVEPGEPSKKLSETERIYGWLLEKGADRNSFILGIGGGVVCDLAGFVASTYMRGLSFGFVATTLLAQVDASVGGKNGVDFQGFKNMIGTFNQPQFVICDIEMLKTLPEEELYNGFAEMIKHALIADHEKFAFMEEYAGELLKCNSEFIEPLVLQSVKIKAGIVSGDEREKGERKKLNLGHTWGHAVESVAGLPHGKSVGIGLEFAARFSVHKGLLSQMEYNRVVSLLKKYNLPVSTSVKKELVFEAMLHDKKKNAGSIDFVLMRGIGNVEVQNIPIGEIREFVYSEMNTDIS